MKPLDEQIRDLQDKHAKEQARLVLKNQILAKLNPEDPEQAAKDWTVFVYTLYNSVGSATRKTSNYETKYLGANPWSIEDLERTLQQFPPLPLAKVKIDGVFTSFLALPMPSDDKHKYEITQPLSIPVTFRMQPNHLLAQAQVNWDSNLDGIGRVQFSYNIPWQHKWMDHDWRRDNFMDGFAYKGNGSFLKLEMTGEAVNWGRGSQEYTGETTIYWTNSKYTLDTLIAAIKKLENDE